MGVSLNHPFKIGFFPYKPTILDTPMTMETSNSPNFLCLPKVGLAGSPLTLTSLPGRASAAHGTCGPRGGANGLKGRFC